jgi:AcrR family transcriptional regulator
VKRREATKEANRGALLAAAREVFADRGLAATGVRDIVRRTDLASGTFYNYFESKEAIFAAVLETVGGEARARVRDARLAAPPEAFLEAGFGAFFAFIASDPATWRSRSCARTSPGACATASTSTTRRTRWWPWDCRRGA